MTITADDLSPKVGDNVMLTLAVVKSSGAVAAYETCILQVDSQPGSDAAVEPLVILTGEDRVAMTTLFAGSTLGDVKVSGQCGITAEPAFITLNVGDTPAPASLPDDDAGSVGGPAGPFGTWPVIMLGFLVALIVVAWFIWQPEP